MNAVIDQHQQTLREAREEIDAVQAHLNAIPEGQTLRQRLPRLLWQHAVEDGDSVLVLVERRNLGSARALLRPQVEALARGAWAKIHATDQQLIAFAAGTAQPPSISQIMALLTTPANAWTLGGVVMPISNLWRDGATAFHDTTHRGTRAIARAALANQGDANHVADDERTILYMACTCASVAAAAMLEDAGRAEDFDAVMRITGDFVAHAHQANP